MYADDLNTPLGQDQDRQGAKRPVRWARTLVVLLAVSGMAAAGWVLYGHDRLAGWIAVTPAKPEPPIIVKAGKPDADPTSTGALPAKPAEPPAGSKTITIIDGATGARKDVVVPQ